MFRVNTFFLWVLRRSLSPSSLVITRIIWQLKSSLWPFDFQIVCTTKPPTTKSPKPETSESSLTPCSLMPPNHHFFLLNLSRSHAIFLVPMTPLQTLIFHSLCCSNLLSVCHLRACADLQHLTTVNPTMLKPCPCLPVSPGQCCWIRVDTEEVRFERDRFEVEFTGLDD